LDIASHLLTYAGGTGALVGSFLDAAVQNYGLQFSTLWVFFGVAAIVAATFCAYRDMRLTGRLLLVLEGLSFVAILALSSIA
jgi:amino acid transporter